VRRPNFRLRRTALVLVDFVTVNVAFAAAYWLRYGAELGGEIEWYHVVPYRDYLPWGLSLSLIVVALNWIEGLYNGRRHQSWLSSTYSLAVSTLVGLGLVAILFFALRPTAQSRLMLIYAAILILLFLSLVRLVDQMLFVRRLRRGEGVRRTVIVGAGERGRTVMRNIVAQPDLGYSVIGFLDDDPEKLSDPIGRFEPLGRTDELSAVLADHEPDEVILALPWSSRMKIMRLVDESERAHVRVHIVPDLFQLSLARVDLESLHGMPLITVKPPALRGWQYRLKRGLDIVGATLGIVLLAPLAIVIAVAIRLDSPGPVHYRQKRLGRYGRTFTCLKFRSMYENADQMKDELAQHNEASGPLFKMRDDPRLTRVGRTLRRFSLDELPQLWNVLLGDMSLVGPRPPTPNEVTEYKDWHRRRLDVAPGMTGLWQVSGRSDLTFDEMVMLDLFYAENWSLALDLRILLRTIPSVLRGTGAY
jgi:exopolysaccharide biosynthesis polyprenyl glycosylphosphotransferase